jgi:opacity protein-like surface antigen
VKRHICVLSLAALVLLPVIAEAQDVPKMELALGYSYLNVHPTKSAVTSFNMNGGGIGLVYNATPLIGIKFDFMGYTGKNSVTTSNNGVAAGVDMFSYMFGPQFKFRHEKVDYFAEALFGAAHSSAGFTQLVYVTGQPPTTVYNSNNSFAMEYGGGLDWKVSHHVSIRPVEVAYLFTRFSTNNVSAQQNSFKYFAGVNFNLGSH